ncbi:MAG: hypothetical protein ABJG68_09035 [Crocinitomicaceae bacterium]
MSNIIKGIYITFLACFLTFGVKGQMLIDGTSNLDVDGEVYSVKKIIALGNYYFAVGDFTTMGNEMGLYNLCVINKNTLIPLPTTFITEIDGPIKDVVYYPDFTGFPTGYLYIAGDFTSVNNQPHDGIARFAVSIQIGNDYNDFTLSSWDPGFFYSSNFDNPGKIHDLEIKGDTIFVSGNLSGVNNLSLPGDERFGITAINPVNGSDYGIFSPNQACNYTLSTGSGANGGLITHTAISKYHLLGSGSMDASAQGGTFMRFDYDGCIDLTYPIQEGYFAGAGGWFGDGRDIEVAQDTIYGGIEEVASTQLWFDIENGYGTNMPVLNNPQQKDYNPPPPSGYTIEYTTMASYQDKFYVGRNVTGTSLFIPTIAGLDSTGVIWQSAVMNENFSDYKAEHLFVADNILFGSIDGSYTVVGEPRQGMFAYCLEPEAAQPFTAFDTTVCQGQIINYSLPNSQYADGYEWTFSNSDVILDGGVPYSIPQTTTVSNINIEFLESFSNGTLTVTPFSTCGGLTWNNNRVYGKSQSLNIHLNDLPNINPLFPDTVINCLNNTITLIGNSDSLGVSYSWNRENSPYGTDPVGQNLPVTQGDIYYLKITGSNGCINRDTISVIMDTIRPNFDPIIPEILGCSDTNYVLGFCNNGTDTTSWWQATGNATILPNPLEVSLIGQYKFYTQFASNGCTDSIAILVEDDLSVPNLNVFGYDSISLDPIDTLNCYAPSLNLQGISDTANTVVNWTDMTGSTFYGEFQNIIAGGLYYLHVIDTSNNCTNTATVVIDENFTQPTLALPTDVTSLNCSNDSLVLDGSTSSSNTTLQWTGQTISPSNNPLTIYNPGTFVFTVTLDTNGCSSVDSLTIIQDNSIDVIVSNDTAVCNTDNVLVTSDYVGNITGITYNWDNGSTLNTSTYIGGTDSIAIVEINGDGGCYGTDTVRIDTPPSPIVNFQAFQPCGSGNDGSIVASPISGWGPFEYSIDNGLNYQTSTALTGLGLGTYTILVKDTIGCEHPFTAAIDVTSAIATPQFLFSTYNFQGDTIIILDVSNPPADSVDWFFSSEIIVLTEDDTSALLILPDTGSFIVTMDAWFGTCLSSLTKEVFVSEFDSTNAEAFYSNGIKSIELYPNPNDGTFTINVEFYVAQNAVLDIYNMVPTNFEHLEFVGTDLISQTITMPLEAMSGEYIIRIISDYDSAYIPFTLIK